MKKIFKKMKKKHYLKEKKKKHPLESVLKNIT